MARVRVRARAMVVVDCSGARHETNQKMSERQEPSGAECQTFREGMMDGTNAGSRGRLPPLGLMRWADRFGRWRSKGSVKWGKQGCGVRGRVEAQPPLATAVTAKGPPRRGSANLTGSFPAFVLHCLALPGPAWPCLALLGPLLGLSQQSESENSKIPHTRQPQEKKERAGRGSAT